MRHPVLTAWLITLGLAAAPTPQGHEAPRPQAASAADAAAVSGASAAAPRQAWGARHFPNVRLLTHEGQAVRFYDDLLKGKAVVINLMYTHCEDACPLETARLAQVRRLLGERPGRDINFYSLSIDPARDTPAVLHAYAEKFQTGPGWLFLTGDQSDIQLLAQRLGLASRTDDADRDGHLPSLMVGVEASGQWMRLSALDNPRFLASKIDSFVSGWNERDRRRQDATGSYAAARPIEGMDAGSYLFRTRCASCHTVGRGDALGPDLAGVTERRDADWLKRFIKTPELLRAERDPLALALFEQYKTVRMPNLRLGDGDVEALIGYLSTHGATAPSRP